MQNQIPNLERYILAELQDMNAADTYIVSADIWVDCEQTHQVVHVLKKSDNTLITTLFVETLTGAISATAPTGSITASACDTGVVSQFQVIDCSGAPLGTPVSVEQTIVLNKVLTSICNPEAIFQPIVDELHDHIEPLLEKLADAVQPYQPVDCAGANVGSPVEASNVKIVNATDIFCAIVTAIDSAKVAIVDAVNNANTDITTAIEASTAVLEEIKTELVTANTTLTNIKTDTASINTKLDTVITKIDTMITSLSSIDTKLTTTNTTLADILVELQGLGTDLADIKIAVESIDGKLDDVITSLTSIETKLDRLHTDLVGIQDTLNNILAELDYELIITSPTVNCATDGDTKVSFYTREKIVWDSETGTQISKTVEHSLDGEDFTATKPTGTVSIGACVTSGDITASLLEFQIEDCTGTAVGDPVDVLPTIVVNKVIASICNVQELADAINAGAKDYTAILDSIDTKLDELALIKAELVTANTTLTDIETNTNTTNTKLDTVITKLDSQVTLLTDLKASIEAGNLKLDAILAKLGDILVSVDAIKIDIAEIKIDIEAIKVAVESIDLKLDDVITSLTSIETKLDTLHTDLVGVKDTLDDILAQLDHELIITSPTINCADNNGTKVSFYTREKIVWDSESGTEISKTIEYSLDGETFNTTKPAGTITIGACATTGDITASLVEFQAKDCDDNNIGDPIDSLPVMVVNKTTTSICNVAEITDPITTSVDAINTTLESSLTTFQQKDCDGNNIGTPEVAQKVINLGKTITSICNVQELADAINDGQATATGKAHDVNSIVMTIGQTLSIPSGHFSTLVFHAAKGEFKIENTSNDHSTIFTTTGTVSKFIEISEDGVGTATGSTNTPMTMDTRSNANDLAITNTYTVTAIRAGVLKLETYK